MHTWHVDRIKLYIWHFFIPFGLIKHNINILIFKKNSNSASFFSLTVSLSFLPRSFVSFTYALFTITTSNIKTQQDQNLETHTQIFNKKFEFGINTINKMINFVCVGSMMIDYERT